MIPWTVACQAPLSMGFPRQGYWSGLPFPSPEDLPDPGIEPGSPALQTDSLPFEPPGKHGGRVGEVGIGSSFLPCFARRTWWKRKVKKNCSPQKTSNGGSLS